MNAHRDIGSEALDQIQSALPTTTPWTLRTERALRWWPGDLEQVVRVDAPRNEFDMEVVKLSIETPLFRDVAPTFDTLSILALLNAMTTGSALVLDPDTRVLRSQAHFYLHEENVSWVVPFATFVTLSQMIDAQSLSSVIEKAIRRDPSTNAHRAVSAHPIAGPRERPDDLRVFAGDLRRTTETLTRPFDISDMQESGESFGPDPSVMRNVDASGVTAEFAFQGREVAAKGFFDRLLGRRERILGTALFEATAQFQDPIHGSGCRTELVLPLQSIDPPLVNQLNLHEHNDWSRVHGGGAWGVSERGLLHAGFVPMAIRRRGVFGNLYRVAALRAQWAGQFLA